jgi:peptidoglycan/xylan/chitin deacetylase (PgdA/CDA1 family)
MKLFRILLFKLFYNLKIGHYLLYKNRKREKVPVLVFHKIIPEYDKIWPGIHPKLFEDIILLLKKHYTIHPLHYLFTQPETDFKKACFITFDDGYKDFLDYAYPILKRNQVHSTIFVLPYNLSNHGHIWTSTIIFFVKHYWFSEIRDFFISHNQYIDYADKFDDFELNLTITRHLCTLQQIDRQVIIDALQQKFEQDNRVIHTELLNFEELKKLDPAYVSVASHSLTHPSFKLETDERFIDYEMRESKQSIEEALSTEVSFFAFPFAKYNELSVKKVKQYYKMCFTRINDLVDLKRLKREKDYCYDMPRYNIHHDSAEEVFLLINGFHQKLKL